MGTEKASEAISSADLSRPFYLEEIAGSARERTLKQARELLLEYGQFVIAQPETARFCYGSLATEAARLPESYVEQGGGCLLARIGEEPAGFIAWREVPENIEPAAWELKRLWVRPAARGLRLGHSLIEAVLERAIAAGRKSIYLDTAPGAMQTAMELYLAMGFRPCAPYNDNPVEGLAYLRKPL